MANNGQKTIQEVRMRIMDLIKEKREKEAKMNQDMADKKQRDSAKLERYRKNQAKTAQSTDAQLWPYFNERLMQNVIAEKTGRSKSTVHYSHKRWLATRGVEPAPPPTQEPAQVPEAPQAVEEMPKQYMFPSLVPDIARDIAFLIRFHRCYSAEQRTALMMFVEATVGKK